MWRASLYEATTLLISTPREGGRSAKRRTPLSQNLRAPIETAPAEKGEPFVRLAALVWWASPNAEERIDDQTQPFGANPLQTGRAIRHCQAAKKATDVKDKGLNNQLLTYILAKEAFASYFPHALP